MQGKDQEKETPDEDRSGTQTSYKGDECIFTGEFNINQYITVPLDWWIDRMSKFHILNIHGVLGGHVKDGDVCNLGIEKSNNFRVHRKKNKVYLADTICLISLELLLKILDCNWSFSHGWMLFCRKTKISVDHLIHLVGWKTWIEENSLYVS